MLAQHFSHFFVFKGPFQKVLPARLLRGARLLGRLEYSGPAEQLVERQSSNFEQRRKKSVI